MRQHSIDLLPEAIRARGQAGVRTSRYIGLTAASIVLIIVGFTHLSMTLQSAEADWELARDRADDALSMEASANELREAIAEVEAYIDRYQRVAHPFDASSVLATVINEMPDGMTMEKLDLSATQRRVVRSPRSKGNREQAPAPRELTVEITGFAPDDQTIAAFISTLRQRPPLEGVGLDFSRTRAVRGRTAREFRLSFRVNLERPFEVVLATVPAGGLEP